MNKFSEGQIVVCTSNLDVETWLTIGKEYTVLSYENNYNSMFMPDRVEVLCDDNLEALVFCSHFVGKE